MKELSITFFVDSNHGYDIKIGKVASGIVCLEASELVDWINCRQLSFQTETCGSELHDLKVVVERATTLRFRLKYMGTHITKPTNTFCDSKSVVKNNEVASRVLSKIHIALLH